MRENKQAQACGLRFKGLHALVIPSKDLMCWAIIMRCITFFVASFFSNTNL